MNDSIFVTGGLGDLLALESFFPNELRNDLTTIYYATRMAAPIKEMFRSLSFPKLRNHVDVWTDFTERWGFYDKEEVMGLVTNPGLAEAPDWSIKTIFRQIKLGQIPYTGSTFMKKTVANIRHFDLPRDYITICPYSTNQIPKHRNFDGEDWNQTLRILKARRMPGVILNHGFNAMPYHDNLIDLNMRTTIPESIEVLKASKGYVGVDSMLSVLAAKRFRLPDLMVKCVNPQGIECADRYFAPHKTFRFLVTKIHHGQNNDLLSERSLRRAKLSAGLVGLPG